LFKLENYSYFEFYKNLKKRKRKNEDSETGNWTGPQREITLVRLITAR
jgi:hypothetical protein